MSRTVGALGTPGRHIMATERRMVALRLFDIFSHTASIIMRIWILHLRANVLNRLCIA